MTLKRERRSQIKTLIMNLKYIQNIKKITNPTTKRKILHDYNKYRFTRK